MKRKLSFIVASLAILSSAAFATNSNSLINGSTLSPVKWHANINVGQFGLTNKSTSRMYVQVNIVSGEIAVYTLSHNTVGCKTNLDAKGGLNSVVCELGPDDSLYGDFDFAHPQVEATGTYQVQMEK